MAARLYNGRGAAARERSVTAGAVQVVLEEIARAQQRFGLPEGVRVVSGYEAGRDGCRLHRFLVAEWIETHVVDSSRIAVNRRQWQAKTDRLTVHRLLTMLLRYGAGVARRTERSMGLPAARLLSASGRTRERGSAEKLPARLAGRVGLDSPRATQLPAQGAARLQKQRGADVSSQSP
jgi:hypothetical protein